MQALLREYGLLLHIPAMFVGVIACVMALALTRVGTLHRGMGRLGVRLLGFAAVVMLPFLVFNWLHVGVFQRFPLLFMSCLLTLYCGNQGLMMVSHTCSQARAMRNGIVMLCVVTFTLLTTLLVVTLFHAPYGIEYFQAFGGMAMLVCLDLAWVRWFWSSRAKHRLGRHVFWILAMPSIALHGVAPGNLPLIGDSIDAHTFEWAFRFVPFIGLGLWYLVPRLFLTRQAYTASAQNDRGDARGTA